MKLEVVQTEAFVITGAPKLDAIRVVLQDVRPGAGGLIVECFGEAWACYWGAIGAESVRGFVSSCSVDYLTGKLWRSAERITKKREEYLQRIVQAVLEALHEPKPVPRCKFDNAYAGQCGREVANIGDFCEEHAKAVCTVKGCGKPAIRSCPHAGQFVCGAPLCGDCEGYEDRSLPSGAWGFLNHEHASRQWIAQRQKDNWRAEAEA